MSPPSSTRVRVPSSNSVPASSSSANQHRVDDILSRFSRSASVDGGATTESAPFESAHRSSSHLNSPTSSRRLAVRLLVGGVESLQVPSPRPPSPSPLLSPSPTPHRMGVDYSVPSPKLPPRKTRQQSNPGHISPCSPSSPDARLVRKDQPHREESREERRDERRRLRKVSHSERPERPSRHYNSSSSQLERLEQQSQPQQQKSILKTSPPRESAWEVCDALSRTSVAAAMASSPSSPLTAASRLCKSKRSTSKCNVAAEAVVAGLEVTAAAAAAADAARDGQWLASGFEELQNKLEVFSVTTQQLAISLEEARKEAQESRAAMDAARSERDLLVAEMEATLSAWSTSDAEKAEELARVEAEKARVERENGELKRELAETKRQYAEIKRQLEMMRAERDAAVTHARVTVARATAAGAGGGGSSECLPRDNSSHLRPRHLCFTPLLADLTEDDSSNGSTDSTGNSSISPTGSSASSSTNARSPTTAKSRSECRGKYSTTGASGSSSSLSEMPILESQGSLQVRAGGGGSSGGLKKMYRSHDALPAYGSVEDGRIVVPQKHVQWSEQCC
ncbi:unnamed protein product [Closterium sp. Yama58-4]|nr:unnamed protein product [Closterium sp. Yama58-4]